MRWPSPTTPPLDPTDRMFRRQDFAIVCFFAGQNLHSKALRCMGLGQKVKVQAYVMISSDLALIIMIYGIKAKLRNTMIIA